MPDARIGSRFDSPSSREPWPPSLAAPPALAAPECGAARASAAVVGEPGARIAWRAGIIARTPLWRSVPKRGVKTRDSIVPRQASSLLVLAART